MYVKVSVYIAIATKYLTRIALFMYHSIQKEDDN